MYENTTSVEKLNSVLMSIFIILSLLSTVMVVSATTGETISIGSEKFTVTDGTLTDSETVILTLNDTEYFGLAGNATILWESTIASNLSRGENIGDVTGDGISDILFVDESNSAPILALYSGVDGSEIWASTINWVPNSNYIDFSNIGDFDGNGVNDILVLVEDYNYPTITYCKTVIRGTDGSQLWQKQESCDSNSYLWMYSIGDINGDAKDDIVNEYSEYSESNPHFNLSIISGGSGSTIWTHTESLLFESWAYADLSPGDLDRDGISDFFIYREDNVYDSTNDTYNNDYQFKAISGKTGSLIWSMTSEQYIGYSLISDIDDDGYNDVVISMDGQTLIIRGYDAYQLHTMDGYLVGTIYDVNGNEFDDIVVSDYENLIALDGKTGDTIWTKPISTDAYFYYAFYMVDENGDGVNDLIALSCRDDQNTSYDIYTGVSGSDGNTLWNKEFEYIYEYNSSTGSEYSKESYLDAIMDLDRNGKQYIVINEHSSYTDSWSSDYQEFDNWTAIKGSDGEVLWNLNKSGSGSYRPTYMDFNNDGVFDVLDYGSDLPSSSSFTAEPAVKSVSSLSTLSASLSQNYYQLPGRNQIYPDTFFSNIELNRPKLSSTDAHRSVSISAMQSSVAPSSPSEVSSKEYIPSYARMFSGDSIENMIWRVNSDTEIVPIIYGWGYYNYNPNDLNSDEVSDVVLWMGDKLYALTDGNTSSDNDAPIANSQSKVTNEGTSVDITLSATDINGDSLTYTIVDGPTNGTVSLSGTINIATYTPNANFSGTDSFTFKVNDGTVDSNTATVSITVTAVNDVPVADSNGPYTGTEGTEITFDGSGSFDPDGDIDSYNWDFGDGTTDTGVTPTHAYGQDGIYTVTLTVTDNDGATDSDSTTVVVGNIAPTVTILSPSAITNDSTPLLHATFDQIAASIWYVIDGAAGIGESNADNLTVTLSELEDGQHTVKVYANNSYGNLGFATQDFFVDAIAPAITIDQVTSPTNVSSQTITGTFNESGTGIDSITVNGESADIIDNNYSADVSLLNEGSNIITVLATDNAGNVGEADDEIVLDTTAPTVDFVTLNNTVVQSGASIEVNVSAADANEIVTVTADGVTLTLTGDYYIGIIIAGAGPVIVNITDEAGNMVTDDSATYIIDDDAPSIVSVTLNNTIVKTGAAIEVNVSATDAHEIVSVTADGVALTLTGDYYIGIITAGASPVIVNITDEAGNMVTDDSATYTIDDDAPVIYSVTLNDTVVQSGAPIEVNVSATDTHEIVTVTADGFALNLTGDYYIGTITAGISPVIVNVADEAGNMATNSSVTYIIDNDAPSVDSVTLNNTVLQSNASIEVNVSAIDANEIVTVTADGVTLTLTGDYYIGTIPVDVSPVIVNVTDEAGNMAIDDSATYIIDDDKPVVNIFEPQQNDSIRFVDNIVRGNVTDANFASAHLIVRNETNVIIGLQYDLIIEDDGSFIERVEYANDQNNTLELCAFDQAGNFNDIYMVNNISVQNNTVHTEVEVEQNIEKTINATDEADVELLINANINTTINVTITAITDVTRLDNLSDTSALRALGNIVEIHVDGINASNASEVNYVTVRMYYTMDDLDLDGDGTIEVGELNEEDLFIYWYDSDNTTWIKLETDNPIWVNSVGRVDTGNYSGYVWAEIRHLSTFGLAAGSVPESIDDSDGNDDYVPPSSGGSSGGGSGSSGEAYGNIAVKEVIRNYVSVDTTNTYQFEEDANAIGFVTFDAKTNAGYIAATVEVLKDTSTLVSAAPSGKVYQNMNIWVGTSGYATENNIANQVIGFKVAKSWITENDIDESTIKLNRYSSGVWGQLPTTKTDEDDSYIYLSSETPGFSPFAITGDEISSTAVADTDPLFSPPSSTADDGVSETVGETGNVPYDEAKSSSGFVLVIGLIVISVLGVGVYLRKDEIGKLINQRR